MLILDKCGGIACKLMLKLCILNQADAFPEYPLVKELWRNRIAPLGDVEHAWNKDPFDVRKPSLSVSSVNVLLYQVHG